jgi:hypothetical protein
MYRTTALRGLFDMALISISKAAKTFEVSRPTLAKALKEGRITGEKTEQDGSETWQIDTAELARLYKLRNPDHANMTSQDPAIGQPLAASKSPDNGTLQDEVITALQSELQALRAERDALRDGKADAERKEAAAQAVADERKRILDDVMKLLPKPDDQDRKSGFWSRVFGGR